MTLTTIEQIKRLTDSAKNILILLPNDPSTDAIASGLALLSLFEKMKKESKIVCNDFKLPPNHQFLPKSKEISQDLSTLQKFIIKLDTRRTKVEELSYDIEGDTMNIFVTPKAGFFEEGDVSTASGGYAFDLIYVLDAADLSMLGRIYDDNAEFFYNTPIINIDHKASNEQFGQVNHVELTATSTSEIVFELIRAFGDNQLDEYMATNLLAGIVSKTKSFQAPTVTPKSLSVASHLIESGARREEIIRHLYQTKSIATLKIWGRALARLRTENNNKLIWTVLSREDFTHADTNDEQLEGVVDELIVNAPDAEVIVVLYESLTEEGAIDAIIKTPQTMDALAVLKKFKPMGSKDFTRLHLRATSLMDAERDLIDTIRSSTR